MTAIDVVLCTHNPHAGRLARTLDGLRAQTLPQSAWSLCIIDNASAPPLAEALLAGFANARIVVERELGLTPARLRGARETAAPLIAFVDDDVVLDARYLEAAVAAFAADPELGVAGGRNIADHEAPPPPWIAEFYPILAVRDLGRERLAARWQSSADPWPAFAPVGAGMVLRREAMERYARGLDRNPARRALDRAGGSLASGGDNDIVMTALEGGWTVSYEPALELRHIIPAGRCEPAYLARLSRASARTWVQMLDLHGRRPWRALPRLAVPALALRYWLRQRAWAGPAARIRWQGYVGQAEGRALLRP
jgi:hypothetical protein